MGERYWERYETAIHCLKKNLENGTPPVWSSPENSWSESSRREGRPRPCLQCSSSGPRKETDTDARTAMALMYEVFLPRGATGARVPRPIQGLWRWRWRKPRRHPPWRDSTRASMKLWSLQFVSLFSLLLATFAFSFSPSFDQSIHDIYIYISTYTSVIDVSTYLLVFRSFSVPVSSI